MRPLRIQNSDQIYHVFNRGNNKRAVFDSDDDYQRFLDTLKRYKKKFHLCLYAYTLMPNHFHLILETSKKNILSRFMQAITLSYALYRNKKMTITGHVWQGRYKQTLIASDESFLRCIRYVELNPVRANLVSKLQYYRWSSYGAHIVHLNNPLIDLHPLILNLSTDKSTWQKSYRDFIESEM